MTLIPIETRIGMLRQWLNEERIKDGKYFVTNEDIEHWLHLYEVALNNVFNKQPSIDDLKEAIWQKLRTDPRADTYVIPERVMDCIVDEAKAQIEQLLQSEVRQAMLRQRAFDERTIVQSARIDELKGINLRRYGEYDGTGNNIALPLANWIDNRIKELEVHLTNKEDK